MGGRTFASTELTYRLFASQTFGFDFALWGLNAFGFHVTNLIAHLGTMLSVWWLLALLGVRVWSSLAGAAVFGFHPLVLATVPVIARTDGLVPALAFTIATCLVLALCGGLLRDLLCRPENQHDRFQWPVSHCWAWR